MRYFISLLAGVGLFANLPSVAAADPSPGAAATPAPAVVSVVRPVPVGEQRAASVARMLAGLPPTLPAHFELAQTREWREHRDIIQAGWAKVKQGRGSAMAHWRDASIGSTCGGSGTLLYPFSGPDFANAYVLFPGCRNYILFGLELPGALPDLEDLDRAAFGKLLGDVRVAVGDLVERNYFITSRMSRQLHTSQLRGVVPVVIASMALAGLEVRSVEPLTLTRIEPDQEIGQPDAKPLRKLRGVQFAFQRPDGPVQTLQYFSVDATDRGLAPYPEFLAYLRAARPAPMLIKSASYLLQDKQFRTIRDALLEAADFLVQDDTGMPYEVLKAGGWDMRLYGGYRKPIKPFHWAYQAGLDAAYKSSRASELPFSFSYHWRGGKSNAMVARRVAVRASAPAAGAAVAER